MATMRVKACTHYSLNNVSYVEVVKSYEMVISSYGGYCTLLVLTQIQAKPPGAMASFSTLAFGTEEEMSCNEETIVLTSKREDNN